MAMKLTEAKIDARLHRLKTKPVENERLIKKWERIKRNYNAKEVSAE